MDQEPQNTELPVPPDPAAGPPAPPPAYNPDSEGVRCCSPGLLLIILLSLIVIPAAIACKTGYADGLKLGAIWAENCLGNLIGLILALFQCLFAIGAVRRCRRIDASWCLTGNGTIYVVILLFLGALQYPMFHNGAYCYAGCQARSRIGRAKADLRTLGIALETYAIDWHGFPANLQSLTTATTPNGKRGIPYANLPPTSFGNFPRPRYAAFTPPGSASPSFWMLWQPGPGRTWSVADGPQLQDELSLLATSRSPGPWLLERMYDPSNGAASGDIILWRH